MDKFFIMLEVLFLINIVPALIPRGASDQCYTKFQVNAQMHHKVVNCL